MVKATNGEWDANLRVGELNAEELGWHLTKKETNSTPMIGQ